LKSNLIKEEKKVKSEIADTLLKSEIIDDIEECIKKGIRGEIDIKVRNKIFADVRGKIQLNKLEEDIFSGTYWKKTQLKIYLSSLIQSKCGF
jgi:hypothetical protein